MSDEEPQSGSLVKRRQLGRELRTLREAANKTADQAAKHLGVVRATITRIEAGRTVILERNVRFLCQLYGVGAPTLDMLSRQAEESSQPGWWATYSDTVPAWFELFVGFETECAALWDWSPEVVPGLLQTEDYMRAMTAVAPKADIDRAVQLRLARQARLATDPPAYRGVLNEAVLLRAIGDMPAQLRHLAKVAAEPWCDLRVLPFSAGPHPGMAGPFVLMTLPEEKSPNFVYLEHKTGATYLERPVDLETYAANFEALASRALSRTATRKMLATLARSPG